MNKYLELIRLPNVITASADSWAGFFIILAIPGAGAAASPAWGILPLIVLVSCVLYAAGVIFNDVVDFEHDKTHRPDRPLPSGRIPRSTAFTAGAVLVVLAMLLAMLIAMLAGWERLIIAFVLLFSIVVYTLLSKAAPAASVPVMGLCRALNVALGMGLTASVIKASPSTLVAPGVLFLCTVAISLISLAEHKDKRAQKFVKYGVLSLPAINGILLLAYGALLASLFCFAVCAGAVILSKRLPVS